LIPTRATSNEQKVKPWKRSCQRDRNEPQSIPTSRCGSLASQEINQDGDVNIFLTHYPIEGFDGYFGQETHIQKSSIPRNLQLFASGHLHNHQRKMINGTPVIYPGSTERVSFNEESERKGFVSLELDKTGIA